MKKLIISSVSLALLGLAAFSKADPLTNEMAATERARQRFYDNLAQSEYNWDAREQLRLKRELAKEDAEANAARRAEAERAANEQLKRWHEAIDKQNKINDLKDAIYATNTDEVIEAYLLEHGYREISQRDIDHVRLYMSRYGILSVTQIFPIDLPKHEADPIR